jgi:Uma2 family endonuclease
VLSTIGSEIMTFLTRISLDTFDTLIRLPENADFNFEYIGGEMLPTISDWRASEIALTIGALIRVYLFQNPIGRASGADGGYEVSGERYIPDVGFVTHEKMGDTALQAYLPFSPDLAIEVVSPTDTERKIMLKVVNYLAAQTIVWVVYPDNQEIWVHVPNQPVQILGINDTLDGGNLLPGLSIPLKMIFG